MLNFGDFIQPVELLLEPKKEIPIKKPVNIAKPPPSKSFGKQLLEFITANNILLSTIIVLVIIGIIVYYIIAYYNRITCENLKQAQDEYNTSLEEYNKAIENSGNLNIV